MRKRWCDHDTLWRGWWWLRWRWSHCKTNLIKIYFKFYRKILDYFKIFTILSSPLQLAPKEHCIVCNGRLRLTFRKIVHGIERTKCTDIPIWRIVQQKTCSLLIVRSIIRVEFICQLQDIALTFSINGQCIKIKRICCLFEFDSLSFESEFWWVSSAFHYIVTLSNCDSISLLIKRLIIANCSKI